MSELLMGFIGLAGGVLVAGGMYALVTTLGVINRLAQDTRTARDIMLYEECVIWGGAVGNIIFVYDITILPENVMLGSLSLGSVVLVVLGVIAGIYAGCLAIALAEVIKTIPVFIMRSGVTKGFGIIVLLMALGKGIGGIVYFFVFGY